MEDDVKDLEHGEAHYNVAMVDRAMKIMDYLLNSEDTAGTSQIAKDLGLPKANIFRILSTLEKWGMVERDPLYENKYQLGKALIHYGQKVKKDINLVSIAKPVLKKMSSDTGETINIGVIHENQIIILHSEQGEASILVSILPPLCSLYNSAMGKIYLAEMPESERKDYFNTIKIDKRTANTITSYDEFSAQKEQIQADGYSTEKEECEYGLSCIAVPLRDKTGKLIAAVSISGPTTRMELKGYNQLIERLKLGAQEIMRHLS